LLVPTRPNFGNGQPLNGTTHQPSLFTNRQVKTNGAASEIHLNGQAHDQTEEAGPIQPAKKDTPTPPPVPRPRLVLNQLAD
jgi:hypothetical protein